MEKKEIKKEEIFFGLVDHPVFQAMQRERSGLDSFPEPIDLNQGSIPGNTTMDDHSASWESMMNPVENRLSSYLHPSSDGNGFAIDCARYFNGWDSGESSSSARNVQDGATGDDSKKGMMWPVSFNSCPDYDARPENWSFGPSNISSTGYANTQMAGRSPSTHDFGSSHGSLNASSNHGLTVAYDCHNSLGVEPVHSIHKPGLSETEPIPPLNPTSSNIGNSSGAFTFPEGNGNSTSSFGTWGSSCKRKVIESSSGQFYLGGSSSSNQQKEKHIVQHLVPDCYTNAGTLSLSSGTLNLSPVNHLERRNPNNGTGSSRPFPSIVPTISESSGRNFTMRSDHRQHESVPFDAAMGHSTRNSGAYAAQLSGSHPIPTTDYSDLRLPINQNNPNHTYVRQLNEARRMHSYGSSGSRGDGSSCSFIVSGERGSGAQEEINIRSSHINSIDITAMSPSEMASTLPDEIDWSFAPATFASSRNHSSGSRIGLPSGGRTSLAAWSPYQSRSSHNNQRSLEPAPWFPVSQIEPQSGLRRSHHAHLPFSSSSDGLASNSRASHRQLHQNSAAFLMAMPGDEINGLHGMTAVEGRHRLIRQVLNAMRRGVRIQSEDYMFADPYIDEYSDLHDRHRDMRLDVDNMSYEELLALGERIGNVNTGLNEDKIRDSMKQRKYKTTRVSPNLEPCCICQENYIDGDDIGILDCGHEFHTGCIKQWLMLKNLCPICKMTALER